MRKLSFAFIIALGSLIATSANAQSDSIHKSNDIRILLNLMDVGSAMQRSLVEEIAHGRENKEQELPPQFWDEFEKEALTSVSSFLERLIPSYDAEFSHNEIKALIAIYNDPAMKKLNAIEPRLTEAAGKAGEAWGEEIGLKVALRIDQQGTSEPAPVQNAKTPTKSQKKK
jgi:uncharacterized protein